MRNVVALTQRELSAYLYSPIAYLAGFAFLLLTGLLFIYTTFIPGQESTVTPLFTAMASAFVLCLPILTMRLLSDEYATGTIETLMTAPVKDVEVVLSKFLGVWLFYCMLLAPTLIHVALIAVYGQLDWGVTLVAYLGMLLLGALYAAVGVFASACTRYQLVAAIFGVGLLAALTFLTDFMSRQWPGMRHILAYLNVGGQFDDFSQGFFDTTALVYFVSGTAFFLFLASKVLESKRWR